MRPLACFPFLTAALLAADLATIVGNVERRSAYKCATWAKRAEAAELHATARRFYERVIELDTDHRIARGKLGYKRALGRWQRDKKIEHEVLARKDKDPKLAKPYVQAMELLEEEHLEEVIRVCGKYGTVEEKRAILLPLLETSPRRMDIHEALGHVRVGDDYVRPELLPLVRAMPKRLAAWRMYDPVVPGASEFNADVPGVEGVRYQRALDCDIGFTKVAGNALQTVARTQLFLANVVGGNVWKKSPVIFLDAKSYTAMVNALHKDPAKARLYASYGDYMSKDFYAIRVWNAVDASERYAHAAGHLTMNARTGKIYPWLAEGFGYLCSLELFDRGNISFVSLTASSRKIKFTRPAPRAKTRAACTKWVRDQMGAGRAYTLRDVCARSLNNLDFCASMQAYTFVRFLCLLDPDAMKRLPNLLKKQGAGAQVRRTDTALIQAYGKSLDQLAPMWRAFVLEITAR